MDINFCIKCGSKLILKEIGDEGNQKYCEKCDKYYFDNPVPCVLVLILNQNKEALLLKQSYIIKDKWTLCSGDSKEVDDLKWESLETTGELLARENNLSGKHFDECFNFLKGEQV